MSATDRLRAMLDERRVEHFGDGYQHITTYRMADALASVTETSTGKLMVRATFETPEQAIEATLGRGECHKLPASGEKTCIVCHNPTHFTMEFGYWRCSECGCECFEGARYCMGCGRKVVDE